MKVLNFNEIFFVSGGANVSYNDNSLDITVFYSNPSDGFTWTHHSKSGSSVLVTFSTHGFFVYCPDVPVSSANSDITNFGDFSILESPIANGISFHVTLH